jgi:phospholipid transport system substrate-binding protein
MLRTIIRWAAGAALVFALPLAGAQETAPDTLIKEATAEVIAILKQNRGHLNSAKTVQSNDLVERKVLPLFDFSRMAQIAVGRNWGEASADQRDALTTEFRTLLVRTYSTALRNYRDEQIEFKPLDAPAAAGHATVKSAVKRSGSTRVTIDYDMEKTPLGWKVYEIRIDGVNVIANYRQTFASKVRDDGIAGLIRALAEKNANYSGISPRRAAQADIPVELTRTTVAQP